MGPRGPDAFDLLFSVLVKRAFCWYLSRSREAASGAVLEIFLVKINYQEPRSEAAPEPFCVLVGNVGSAER